MLATILYAMLIWFILLGTIAARRRAYLIGVSPVCTACGAAVVRDTDS